MARRLNMIGVAFVIVAVLLALIPQWYRSPGGYQGEKAGVVESKVVGCGITFAPRNPPPPPGTDDQCDAQHTRRGAMVAASLTGAAVFGVLGRLARRRSLRLPD